MTIHIIIRLLIFILGIPLSATVIGMILLISSQSSSQRQNMRCSTGDIYAFFLGFEIGFLLYIVFLLTEAYFLNKKATYNKRNFNLITVIVLFLLVGIPVIFEL